MTSHENTLFQGVVIPIGTVVTAATGVKKQSRGQGRCRSSGQGQFLNSVTVVKMFTFCACILHIGSRSRLRCGQTVKQQKQWSKFFDPGRSRDYSAYRSDHPLSGVQTKSQFCLAACRPDSHTGRSLVKFPSPISTDHKLSSVTVHVLQTKSVRFVKYRTYTNLRRCSSIRKCATYISGYSRFHI